MTKEATEEFFPDWKYEILSAKEIGYLPSDCVGHISCINCGPNRVAYGSDNLSSVYFSEITTPSIHTVKLELKTAEKILGLEWLQVEPYHLLVILEKSLAIIDTTKDEVIHQAEAIDLSVHFIDAHWTKDGNVVSLSHKDAITFYDNELQIIRQLTISDNKDYRKSNDGEYSFCFAVDDTSLYVGQHRDVLIYDISVEGEMNLIDTFVAHPHDIKKIQILNNNIVTLSNKGVVIWDKRDLVPLFTIKSSGTLFYADPTGTFGIDSNKQLFKLAKGKKSEIMRTLQLNITEPIVSAAWEVDENANERYLHIGSYGQKEFCIALVIKFTHQ